MKGHHPTLIENRNVCSNNQQKNFSKPAPFSRKPKFHLSKKPFLKIYFKEQENPNLQRKKTVTQSTQQKKSKNFYEVQHFKQKKPEKSLKRA